MKDEGFLNTTDQRKKGERRIPGAINANPPYLTKQGTILYDRRVGGDRRKAAYETATAEVASAMAESLLPSP